MHEVKSGDRPNLYQLLTPEEDARNVGAIMMGAESASFKSHLVLVVGLLYAEHRGG